jgi:hypothetical protein
MSFTEIEDESEKKIKVGKSKEQRTFNCLL